MIEFKNDAIKTSNNVLVLGNGFDLALGMKSSFKDVIRHIIYSCVLWNYMNVGILKQNLHKHKNLSDALGIKSNNTENSSDENNEDLSDAQMFFIKSSFHNDEEKIREIHNLLKNRYFKAILKRLCPNFNYLKLDDNTELNKERKDNFLYLYGLTRIKTISFFNLPKNMIIPEEYKNKNIKSIDYLIESIDNSNIDCWYDFESYIELAVTHNYNLKIKYNIDDGPNNKSPFLLDGEDNNTKEFRNFVSLFENVLHNYLKKCNELLTNNKTIKKDLTQKYLKSLQKRSNGLIEHVSLEDIYLVINYNYTTTYKDLFKSDKSLWEFHVNGQLSSGNDDIKTDNLNNIVVGFSIDEAKLKNFANFNKDFFIFEKKTRRVIKNVNTLNLENALSNKPYNLIIFGHSCCLADSKELKPLLNSPHLRIGIIFCYNEESLINCYNNIRYMLGESRMDELQRKKVSYKDYNQSSSLFFALSSDSQLH